MTVLLLALATTALAQRGPALAPPAPNPACSPAALQRAGVAPAQLRRLDELPPAQLHLTVIRRIGGCQVATVKVHGAVYYVPLGSRRPGWLVPARPERLSPAPDR